MTTRLSARDLTLSYGDRIVAAGLDLHVPDGRFTAVVGANACGKSTVLRALVRLLAPSTGAVVLDGRDIADLRPKVLARELGFLPQGLDVPENLRSRQLVARGRYPHREVDSLSGGQRQRVWIAMVLAQETGHLLLDEPTTFLDLTHQYQLLRVLAELRDAGRTVVAVLHDINQACRYADHLIAMKQGRVVASGAPADVVDAELMAEVFDLPCLVVPDPVTGTPMVVPML